MRLLGFCFLSLTLMACGASSSEITSQTTGDDELFPMMPDPDKTPGEVCSTPDRFRYPEQIPYCNRNVSTSTKREIIAEYDRELGFQVGDLARSKFKIDHYISLCMGGSNSKANLWPQHRSVYEITDNIEHKLCRLLAAGDVTQAYAIETLKFAKHNLDEAPGIEDQLDDMLD